MPDASVSPLTSRLDFDSKPVKLRIEIGGVSLTPRQLAGIEDGHIIALEESIDEPVEVYAGEKLVARGQVVLIDDECCVQLDEVLHERLRDQPMR